MLFTRFYYSAKPWLPWRLRMGIRRAIARWKRSEVADVWPIKESAGRKPYGWPGWSEGKQFAFVLTHDVESQVGLEGVRPLAELEMELGFRSSFNFIPEGEYRVTKELRHWLIDHGFEVGVHDLKHDGKLYQSREAFADKAKRINHYLKEWNAVGFRSGFMLNRLDWLHDLDIQYDASTFDTDPFEPQPDGVDTIFPFWVPRVQSSEVRVQKSEVRSQKSEVRSQKSAFSPQPLALSSPGYVELPYTLPQDSNLFLVLGEKTIDVWKQKLDWVAKQGGMVLINTHPDYMSFGSAPHKSSQYPVSFYEQLLRYVRSRYDQNSWQALPGQVANAVRDAEPKKSAPDSATPPRARRSKPKPKIWIDLDNTPHVPFFEPIIEELASREFPLLVTARDAFQVCELADKKGLNYIKVGRHHGKNMALKAAGLMHRALQLAPFVLREKPALGVSHGARSQLLLGTWLRIPTILIEDYEYTRFPLMMRPTWIMAPDVISDDLLCCKNGHIRKYCGIKEDVYVRKLHPDPALLGELGLSESDLIVTVRPPATEAHYHNPESEKLFERFMDRACNVPEVRIVLLPRNHKQGEFIRHCWPAWFRDDKTVIPAAALDGLNLMWHSDLVVSGGGTMNREAAALGVPVYSIFRGTIGSVDRHLNAEGRLLLVESSDDVDRKIHLVKRQRRSISEVTSNRTLQQIVDTIQEIAELQAR